MADVFCPICGKKNWLPDNMNSVCFFCGNPLSPWADSVHGVQYAPPPKPEMSVPPDTVHSPSAAQDAPAPSGQTGTPAGKNTEEMPPEMAYLAEYIAEDLGVPPPKGADNLPGIRLPFGLWFVLNTIYICTLMGFFGYLYSGPEVSDVGTVLIPIMMGGATFFFPIVLSVLPFKAKKPGSDSETISFRGFLSGASYVCLMAAGMARSCGLDIIGTIIAGFVLSILAHLIKLLRGK